MTVKQLIVGALLGASAVALMLHRMPKSEANPAMKLALKQPEKASHINRETRRKRSTEERVSPSKVFG